MSFRRSSQKVLHQVKLQIFGNEQQQHLNDPSLFDSLSIDKHHTIFLQLKQQFCFQSDQLTQLKHQCVEYQKGINQLCAATNQINKLFGNLISNAPPNLPSNTDSFSSSSSSLSTPSSISSPPPSRSSFLHARSSSTSISLPTVAPVEIPSDDETIRGCSSLNRILIDQILLPLESKLKNNMEFEEEMNKLNKLKQEYEYYKQKINNLEKEKIEKDKKNNENDKKQFSEKLKRNQEKFRNACTSFISLQSELSVELKQQEKEREEEMGLLLVDFLAIERQLILIIQYQNVFNTEEQMKTIAKSRARMNEESVQEDKTVEQRTSADTASDTTTTAGATDTAFTDTPTTTTTDTPTTTTDTTTTTTDTPATTTTTTTTITTNASVCESSAKLKDGEVGEKGITQQETLESETVASSSSISRSAFASLFQQLAEEIKKSEMEYSLKPFESLLLFNTEIGKKEEEKEVVERREKMDQEMESLEKFFSRSNGCQTINNLIQQLKDLITKEYGKRKEKEKKSDHSSSSSSSSSSTFSEVLDLASVRSSLRSVRPSVSTVITDTTTYEEWVKMRKQLLRSIADYQAEINKLQKQIVQMKNEK